MSQIKPPIAPEFDGAALDARFGQRRFGRVNWLGMRTLARREILRFVSVWQQTLLAPLITAGLFLTVFALAFGQDRGPVMGVPYLAFLAPGILMMTVIQNAFANTSSSIIIAKVQGNIVDTLMPPISPLEMLVGYLIGAAARSLVVAVVIALGIGVTIGHWPAHPAILMLYVLLGAMLLGGLGIAAAVYANKFDQMAAITNFIVTPLSFLSGTFYSADALPPVFRALTHWNPVFYLIDGARFGMIGASDAPVGQGIAVIAAFTVLVLLLCWNWLRTGYRMKP